MTPPAPDRQSSRYTPPGGGEVPSSARRPTAVRLVAALVVLALVLAPLAFLFAL